MAIAQKNQNAYVNALTIAQVENGYIVSEPNGCARNENVFQSKKELLKFIGESFTFEHAEHLLKD